jgi:heterodisulfide reductase subunit B
MTLRYAFFPGCVMPTKYPHFERATRSVAEALHIELVDLPFSCCPPVSNMKMVHYDSWLALAARNLCIAEEQELNIMTGCTGCVNTLKEANYIMREKPNRRHKVNRILKTVGKHFNGTIEVKHLLDALYDDVGLEAIGEQCAYSLNWRVASHYGCHLFRPSYIMYPEFLSPTHSYVPTSIDEITEALGGKPVACMRRFLCCGYPLGANVDEDASYDILREKLHYIKAAHADAIAVGCSSCFEQFELGQVMLRRKYKESLRLPTLYISQMIGLAMGMDPKALGLHEHIQKVIPLLERVEKRRQQPKMSQLATEAAWEAEA